MKTQSRSSHPRSEKNLDWLKILLPVVETGVTLYLSGKAVQKTAHHAKEMALRSAILVGSLVACVTFLIAAVILTFVDLGYQFEMTDRLFISGPIQSAIYLAIFGLLQFGVVYGIVKIVSKRAQHRENEKIKAEPHSERLAILGEQLLRSLVTHLGPTKEEVSMRSEDSPPHPTPTVHHH